MALALVWTKRAIQGFDKIVRYLEEDWTIRSRNFIRESDEFFTLLSDYPELLQNPRRHKNVHRGPMNKLTIITYRVKPRKHQIEIINVERKTKALEVIQEPVSRLSNLLLHQELLQVIQFRMPS